VSGYSLSSSEGGLGVDVVVVVVVVAGGFCKNTKKKS